MKIKSLVLAHFRNYKNKVIKFNQPITILVGPNAVGKTSIIEAIHLIASGDSFRATKIEQMIEFDQELARVKGKVETNGIILLMPFDSLPSVAQHHYWFFLGKWLTRDKFNNITNLKNYSGNVAVLLAEKDEIIPTKNTLKLYNAIAGKKLLWKFAESDHNSLPIHPSYSWWEEVMSFVDNK